jgi:hypothetical protein
MYSCLPRPAAAAPDLEFPSVVRIQRAVRRYLLRPAAVTVPSLPLHVQCAQQPFANWQAAPLSESMDSAEVEPPGTASPEMPTVDPTVTQAP